MSFSIKLFLNLVLIFSFLQPNIGSADVVSNLQANWNFDAGSGSVISDSTGNNNSGTLNGPTWTTLGRINGGLNFDGLDDYIDIGDKNLGQGVSAFTTSVWIKENPGTPANNGRGLVCYDAQSGVRSFCLSIQRNTASGKVIFEVTTGTNTTQSVFSNDSYAGNNWSHIVAVYNGQNLKMYINGVLQTSQPALTGVTVNNNKNLIINFDGYGNNFSGTMDDVRIYNRALSDSDVTELYTLTNSSNPTIPTTPPTTTPSDTTPPTLSNISVGNVTTSGATITYTTNESSTSQVQYGLSTSYGTNTSSGGTTSHSVTLTGLTANTTYNYRVSVTDASGNNALSGNQTFTTSQVVVVPPTTTPVTPPTQSGSWVPPIGIPSPSFGINEQPGSVTHVVCPTCSGSTDNNNPNGSNATPRSSLPGTLSAGSVVLLKGRLDGLTNITAVGTASNPVFIIGDTSNRALITREVWLRPESRYVIIDNLLFTNRGDGSAGRLFVEGQYTSIRNSEFTGNLNKSGGLFIMGGAQHVAYKNNLHDMGDVNADNDQDSHCAAIGGSSTQPLSYVWFVDNIMARCSGDGLQINGGFNGNSNSHHFYIGRNESYGHKQTAMWTKNAQDVIFSQNYGHNLAPSNSSTGACFGGQYGPQRIWWLFNRCDNATFGIMNVSTSGLGDGTHWYLVGNVMSNITDRCVTFWPDSVKNIAIVNNTCTDRGINIETRSGGAFIIQNNIATQVTFLNGQGSGSTISNNFTGTPQFVGSGNYRLQSNSGAINTGVLSSVYATFQSLYGINILVDADRASRPIGVWDAGAYEFGGIVTTPTPTTPPVVVPPVIPTTPTPIPTPTSAVFTSGQRIQTTANVNVRGTPSSTGTLLGNQTTGSLGTIVGTSVYANDIHWWNVNYDSGVDGYSAEGFLQNYVAPTVPTPPQATTTTPNVPTIPTTPPVVAPQATTTPSTAAISVGDRVQTIAKVNVRLTAGGLRLGTQNKGIQGTVTEGPRTYYGYSWYKVNYNSGIDGWTRGDLLTKVTTTAMNTEQLQNQIASIYLLIKQLQEQLSKLQTN